MGVVVLYRGISGIERQMRDRVVGSRSCIPILLSTYIFIEVEAYFQGRSTDPTRILCQDVTRADFLGQELSYPEKMWCGELLTNHENSEF